MSARRLASMFVTGLLFAAGVALAEPNVALDNILVSKINGVTTVQIWPGCRMRYVDHSPAEAGRELRIRVSTGPDCVDRLDDVFSERYAQGSLRLGYVDEVYFEARSASNTFITLRFVKPQSFVVRQHPAGWIEVDVDTTIDSSTLPAAMPAPLAPPPDTRPPPVFARPAPVDRTAPAEPRSSQPRASRPAQRVNVPPSTVGDYVVQLGVFEDLGPSLARLDANGTKHFGYATEFEVNGRTWYGLQLGFFNSEADAAAVLANLSGDFPDAWVRFTSADEATIARAGGDVREQRDRDFVAVRANTSATADAATIDALMSDGRRAMLERRYADAERNYTRALEIPGHARRAEARESLGVALERSGQTGQALAEYQAFLDENPESPDRSRVEARMNGLALVTAEPAPQATASAVPRSSTDGWQLDGGISHYYWRNQEQIVHDGNYRVSASGVLGLADATLRRRGARFDVLARFNGAYQHNLVEFDSRGDIGWVSDAFVDVVDHRWGLQGRFGRQSNRRDGVTGRFDGLSLSYQWRPDISFGVSAGLPIDSPRFISGSERFFYAASATIENLLDDRLTASVFTQQQTVDSIADRQAVGGEVQYRDGPLSVVALVDFDVSYNVLNSLLVNASWLMENGWTLNARGDVGAMPYLTTRNALAGQTATTIDELLLTYTEAQIRTLARDRTAQASSVTIGLSIPLGERFDISTDVTFRQSDATEASGGVAALPATGSQMFLNATLVGTSILRENDLMLFSLRHNTTRTRDTTMFMVDSRLPFGGLRIAPRIRVEQHSFASSGTDQTVVTPSVRLLYRWNSVLLELEAGGRWSSRDVPVSEPDPFTQDGVEELKGGYINLGYRWEF
ncbi:MAG: SPOR domain-containing protein [Woeseiaceae bacterium]|nr:SPOR domain-containing protein [Woeseiaceae bacterium]